MCLFCFLGMCIIDFINNALIKIKQGTKLKLSPLLYKKISVN